MTSQTSAPPPDGAPAIDQLCVNTIRTLTIDAVQQANSGHPGTPMGLAALAYELWQNHLVYDPQAPLWANRDRFVLSVGHASMLLYSLLHLTGVKAVGDQGETLEAPAVSLDDIKKFRQLDSRCPGHPEYRWTSGVETTTGPLGQGAGNSVGMAIAERWLAARYNRPGFELFNYRVYTLCGDGDMMEGVSAEAASVAGHLQLSNLVWIYDSNTVTIEGHTDLAFNEDVGARFAAYKWHVLHVPDANDMHAVAAALDEAATVTDRPTMIVVNSHIGFGSPNKHDSSAAHSDALGEEEVKLTKRAYGWPEDAQFLVPDGVSERFAQRFGKRGQAAHATWNTLFADYRKAHPELATEVDLLLAGKLPDGWDADLPVFDADAKGVATRESSGKVLNALAKRIPWLLGGAADLAPSTKTNLTFEGAGQFGPPQVGDGRDADNYGGRNLHYGVREHAMGSITNGLALSMLRPYASTFLIFSDYMKPPVRLSAIMEVPSIFIFTHDSFGVGEDGPTHQPIEQLAALRSVPGLRTLRPGDANEVTEAWRVVLSHPREPACLILSRQPLPTVDRKKYASAAGVARGAYVLADAPGNSAEQLPEVILMGTGSEVHLCVEAYERLVAEGIRARVVSMPSWDIFEKQDEAYRESVLPDAVRARVGVEQAASLGWDRYTGINGTRITMHTFGASAPLKALSSKFGFTPDKVYEAAKKQVERLSP
ncbi:MAG: transketolase [Janthinobacterium lividum]